VVSTAVRTLFFVDSNFIQPQRAQRKRRGSQRLCASLRTTLRSLRLSLVHKVQYIVLSDGTFVPT
jgi:hypothetical protein